MSAARCFAAALAAACAGCAAVGDITGAVAGFAAGAATANPAIGISVGIGVRAAAREGIQYLARSRQQDEHDAIVGAVADLPPGETRAWRVDALVMGDARGEARVIRVFETPLARCKEIAFSVLNDDDAAAERAWFTTVACHDGATWRWALAEPAVERWKTLQ